MLSIKFYEEEDPAFGFSTFIAEVNGISDTTGHVSMDGIVASYMGVKEPKAINVIREYSFGEVGKFVWVIYYTVRTSIWHEPIDIRIYLVDDNFHKAPLVEVFLPLAGSLDWAKPWSVANCADRFKVEVELLNDKNVSYQDDTVSEISDGFGLAYQLNNYDRNIGTAVDFAVNTLESLLKKANEFLLNASEMDIFATHFRFPDSIKTACKQYLVYFAQFLADLGINAETEIEENGGNTLFRVVPENKQEGLEKIREVLNTYMNAPANPVFETQAFAQMDIAVMHWASQVQFLKSQALLSKSIIQAKDATIEILQLSNYDLKSKLEADKLFKTETVVPDILKLKKIEIELLTVNVPELWKRLKRRF